MAQATARPEIETGTDGTVVICVIVEQVGKLLPQLLKALTQIFPPENEEPKLTEIDSELETPVAPFGRIQLYPVALLTGAILYIIPF